MRSLATTAIAPAAPLIMPGVPPRTAVINPMKNVAYSPTNGYTFATKENATLSGICINTTVIPDNTSICNLLLLFL